MTIIQNISLISFQLKYLYPQGRRSGSTTATLVGPKILPFAVKVLYFQNFNRTNNCLVEVFLKWSDQSRTPSATPDPGFQSPLEKRKNGTSGSVRHPVVLHIQSEANLPILGYFVIGQILTGDPHFHNTMFWLHFKWLREAATYGDTLYD